MLITVIWSVSFNTLGRDKEFPLVVLKAIWICVHDLITSDEKTHRQVTTPVLIHGHILPELSQYSKTHRCQCLVSQNEVALFKWCIITQETIWIPEEILQLVIPYCRPINFIVVTNRPCVHKYLQNCIFQLWNSPRVIESKYEISSDTKTSETSKSEAIRSDSFNKILESVWLDCRFFSFNLTCTPTCKPLFEMRIWMIFFFNFTCSKANRVLTFSSSLQQNHTNWIYKLQWTPKLHTTKHSMSY